MRLLRALAVVGAVFAAIPAGSFAATSTSLVSGLVGTELSVAAATPAALSFTHATPAQSTSLVTVTSTQVSWTLSIADNNTGTNSGHMLKTAGSGAASVGSPFNNALQWSPNGTTFSDLTGSNATVGTGALVGTKTVTYQQALDAAENVTAGDTYQLTAKFTVS